MTTIAIIGTGNVGSAIGAGAVKAGYDVVFAGQDTGKTESVAEGAGASAATTPREAVAAADIVVLAVPYGAVADVAREIAPVAAGKIVIDPTNPLKSDGSGLATAPGTSGAESIAALLPDAKVVKAFNTLFATNTADPSAHGTQLDSLFASIGLRPVHVGPLAASRELEAMAWLNIRMQMLTGGHWNTAFVMVDPPEAALTYGR
jgi:predicted dinucleotide-binding enzyme